MLSTRPLATSALALLGLATTLGFARNAHASGEVNISATENKGPLVVADVLTITSTGVLKVDALRAMQSGMGQMRIIANTIIIEKGGVLTATAAGSVGVNGVNGGVGTSMGVNGGGQHPSMKGQPGGGGGYFGAGASGASDMCVSFVEAAGGVAWAMPTLLAPVLGSGGGAANVTTVANAGGDGGGVILIQANDIQLEGTIEARGASPLPVAGIGPGGGSGGFISIVATHLKGGGLISVAGGAGAAGDGVPGTIAANNGGGGAGGVISLHVGDVSQTILDRIELKGGVTGKCSAALEGAAGSKTVTVDGATFCVDADGDTYASAKCGGPDCDDTSDKIHPKVAELCNNVDDDCNGKIDDDTNGAICSAGSMCDSVQMKCVDISDAGSDGGTAVDAGAPPDHIAFDSGCSLGGESGGVGALAMATLGAAALVARRRRASGSARIGR